jgi:SAM-dependent methyltransferase
MTASLLGQLDRALRGVWRRARQMLRRPTVKDRLAPFYLRGRGLEIGALHNPLRVSPRAKVHYVDRLPVAGLRAQYPDLRDKKLVRVDVVDDGERLDTVGTATQDFVIANHFLEHCQDPIRTLESFFRVLKPGGILYMAVPDKRFTFDRDRPVTPLAHLLRDHAEGPAWSRRAHYEEYVVHVHRPATADEARGIVEDMMARGYSIHFHVWTQKELLELILSLKERLGLDIEVAHKNGDEFVLVLRKC